MTQSDKLKEIGKIGPYDAALWIHAQINDNGFRGFISIEWADHERDFRNLAKAGEWFNNEQDKRKQSERKMRNEKQRSRYWKKHTTFM